MITKSKQDSKKSSNNVQECKRKSEKGEENQRTQTNKSKQ